MAFEQKPNSGTLFRNEEKRTENSPDASGTALIGGVKYKISGWIKQGQNGKRFTSLSFKPADEPSYADRRDPPRKPMRDEIDDDIPWG